MEALRIDALQDNAIGGGPVALDSADDMAGGAIPPAGGRVRGRVPAAGGSTPAVALASAELFGAPSNPPTAVAQPVPPVQGCLGCLSVVTMDGAGSSDPDGDVLTYTARRQHPAGHVARLRTHNGELTAQVADLQAQRLRAQVAIDSRAPALIMALFR